MNPKPNIFDEPAAASPVSAAVVASPVVVSAASSTPQPAAHQQGKKFSLLNVVAWLLLVLSYIFAILAILGALGVGLPLDGMMDEFGLFLILVLSRNSATYLGYLCLFPLFLLAASALTHVIRSK